MDADLGMDLIYKAIEEEQRARAYQQWVVQLPYMDKDTYVSFDDYWERLSGANIDRRSVAEIEADVADAEKELQRGGGQ